ncbi:dehydration-responsive element-binding protein 1I-like [Phragmites australis]|uniref:dehydration-responsive element-binding protein 1I-like n=1 Tax=Phragmites australis TaxID=29695 RepID=UPI002D7909EA|nr:dehydration-responsive element-binding protein 1I-like [Phragmites australis]
MARHSLRTDSRACSSLLKYCPMCLLKQESSCESTSSSLASTSPSSAQHLRQVPAKRPAGRTKFRETHHPVFRGVRRRGRAGRWRWVCEVRLPGRSGSSLWLGTFRAAEAAARTHDAAMLALRGLRAAAACLNFDDSAWLLPVPPPTELRGAGDVQRAVARAVEGFLQLRRREAAAPLASEDAMSATSEPSATDDDAATETEASSAAIAACMSDVVQETSPFELDMLSDMGAGLYYASLAEGLLMEPPTSASCSDDGDGDVADVSLWSY